MTAYAFDLPRSFDPGEFLTPRMAFHAADAARWFISTVLRKTAAKDVDPWGLVRLDSRILRRVMGRDSSEIIAALEQGGAIETKPYCPNVKCKGYRLAKRYLGDHCVRRPAVDPFLIDRLNQERQRQDVEERQSRWKPIHYALDAQQRRLTIDPEADAIVDALPDHARLCQHVLVTRLQHREFPFSVSSTGRCFNGITGLKRELRSALRIDGERLGGVDIACAQPALLALAMAHNTPTNGLLTRATYKHGGSPVPLPAPPLTLPSPAPDSPLVPGFSAASPPDFGSLVFAGRLYEVLMDRTGLDRDPVKLGFLRDVLAKRGSYPSPVESAFRTCFPAVYAFIRAVNRDDHAELIRHLQRMESWLVVETVAPRLIGRVPILTLHDAIYSCRRNLGTVEAAFGEVFDEIGCRLKLKREVG